MPTTPEIAMHLKFLRRALARWASQIRPQYDDEQRRLIQDEVVLLNEVLMDHSELTGEISPLVVELKRLLLAMMN